LPASALVEGEVKEAMKINATQELLPPITSEPTGLSGWWDWLTQSAPGQLMLPASGLLIMGLDWMFFSEEAATLGLALPFTIPVGFLTGCLGAYHLQRKYARDSKAVAGLKSLLAGFLVGLPFPLAGTLAGAWIVANSGLASIRNQLWHQRFGKR
jgi:hypothetical protein